MKKNKKKASAKLLKFEKRYTSFGVIALFVLWVVSFFAKVSLSSINVEVERLDKEVKQQEKTNQSLTMKINELASLENLESVAKKMGLSYTSNSIKTID